MKENITQNRPALSGKISIADFTAHYWLKEELQAFCREYGLKTTGGKIEIAERIEFFLRTGKSNYDSSDKKKSSEKKYYGDDVDYNNFDELSLETPITENFKCSQEVRKFFKEIIGPKFHFSVSFQNYCKNNIGKTFKDAMEAYHDEKDKKKNRNYRTKIAPQFEYNTYIRAFFDDNSNTTYSLKDAIKCWKHKKSKPGHNRYEKKDLEALKD